MTVTTNAIDRVKKIIASDSRWSVEHGEFLIWVDDTGFDKIANRPMGSIICAGDGLLIDEWRRWFMSPILYTGAMPRTQRQGNKGLESITISYVQWPDATVRTYNGWYASFGEHAMFSGSGASYALDCFAKNRCSIKSIGSAMEFDPLTGGKTMFVEVETNRHNLCPTFRTLADAQVEMDKRGEVMHMKTGKRCSFAEFRSGHASAVHSLSAADLSLSAPTGQPARAWTQEERDEFKRVLEQGAAMEADMKLDR